MRWCSETARPGIPQTLDGRSLPVYFALIRQATTSLRTGDPQRPSNPEVRVDPFAASTLRFVFTTLASAFRIPLKACTVMSVSRSTGGELKPPVE
jgi:hypothetical protein